MNDITHQPSPDHRPPAGGISRQRRENGHPLDEGPAHTRPSLAGAVKIAALCLALWFGPLLAERPGNLN